MTLEAKFAQLITWRTLCIVIVSVNVTGEFTRTRTRSTKTTLAAISALNGWNGWNH